MTVKYKKPRWSDGFWFCPICKSILRADVVMQCSCGWKEIPWGEKGNE